MRAGPAGRGAAGLGHDPEKWVPVFRKRSCSNKKIERDGDSTKSHLTSSHLERKFVTLVDSSNLCSGESSWLMQVSEAGRSRRWCLVRRSGRTWRGKFVVIALPDRYLSDAARSYDARMDCQQVCGCRTRPPRTHR